MVGKGTLRGAFSVYHGFKPLVTLKTINRCYCLLSFKHLKIKV